MTTMQIDRAVVEQALEALIIAWQQQPRWQITESMHNLRAALAQQAEPQDAELSAALGWPGGISEPVLDRKTLLRQVADLRAALVAAAERERRAFEIAECYRCGWDSGANAERVECARACIEVGATKANSDDGLDIADLCAAAIRARGEE
jgi:hypothetical protein